MASDKQKRDRLERNNRERALLDLEIEGRRLKRLRTGTRLQPTRKPKIHSPDRIVFTGLEGTLGSNTLRIADDIKPSSWKNKCARSLRFNVKPSKYVKFCKYVNTLKLSLPHIVEERIDNEDFWRQINNANNVTLSKGLSEQAKKIYNDVMSRSLNDKKILEKKQMRLEVSKMKTMLLEADEEENLEILDIIEVLAKNCIAETEIISFDESELTCYKKFMKVLDDIFDGTKLDLVDDEIVSKTTKAVVKNQENIFEDKIPLNKGFGRRINLILAAKGNELSSSKWKELKTPLSKSINQQSIN
ncbi:hypothetical protein K501DRAFT_307847 [Backusella circina FSU 941]|nr:hypothetical protein K501DRAFT_307847 [Backusella circina FSU 941]